MRTRGARSALALLVVLGLSGLVSGRAAADTFSFWLSARGDYFSGTGDVFQEFSDDFGGGVEVGFELFEITLFLEGIVMGGPQYLLTANVGFDGTWGDTVRFGLGLYTGPMFFFFPDRQANTELNLLSQLTPSQQQTLLSATGASSIAQLETQLDRYQTQEQDLSRMAFGWNLPRGRMWVDANLGGPLWIGLAGQLGYHFILSGEDAAANIENEAIDRMARDYQLPSSLTSAIKDVAGARPVSTQDLDGLNWDVFVFLRLDVF